MNEFLALYEVLAKAGFPLILFFILVGNFLDIWRWGKVVRTDEQRNLAREAKLEAECARLQKRLDQLFDEMVDAAQIINSTAKKVGQR